MDDEEALGRGLARVLRKQGFTIALATGGEQALELVTGSVFDVVLSDVRMPGIDGLELLRRIRELGLGVPVVLMTGDPEAGMATRARKSGAFGFLTKPLDHEDLVALLEKAVGAHRATR